MNTINPVQPQDTPTTGTTSTGSSGLPTSQGLNNMFLQLLVAQLQNQDPLDPMDPTQFVGQLAQFSELSEVTQIEQTLQGLVPTSTGRIRIGKLNRRHLSRHRTDCRSQCNCSSRSRCHAFIRSFGGPGGDPEFHCSRSIHSQSSDSRSLLMPNFSIPLSGLTAESTALSTIANNLSNQNTTGYKDKVVLFSDLFYQTLGTTGAGDPIQVGAGTQVGATAFPVYAGQRQRDRSAHRCGHPRQRILRSPGQPTASSATLGPAIFPSSITDLVTSSGQQVLGYPAANGVVNTGAGIAPLQLGAGTISPPTQTGNVQLSVNLNASTIPTDPPYSTPMQIYDSLGAAHTLTATFTNTAPNTWDYSLSIPGTDLSAAAATGVLATGTLTFNGSGVLVGDTATAWRSSGARSSTMSAMSAGWSLERPSYDVFSFTRRAGSVSITSIKFHGMLRGGILPSSACKAAFGATPRNSRRTAPRAPTSTECTRNTG